MQRLSPVETARDGFKAGVDYIRLRLLTRHLRPTRMSLASRYPAVHLRAHCGDTFDFHTFIAPEFLGQVGDPDLHKILQNDESVLGPIAYRSGLQLEFGLFGAVSNDRLDTVISIFKDLSKHASVPYVSSALPFAALLKNSIDRAFGNDRDIKLNVGFKGSLGALPGPGVYAVVFTGGRKLQELFLNAQSQIVDTNGRGVSNAPYMVFEVDKLTWRDDWDRTPDLKEPWQIVRDAGRAGHRGDFESAIGAFKRACILSLDLCRDQRDLLKEFANEVLEDARDTFGPGYETSGDFSHDFDPGDLSSAFDDVFESYTPEGDEAYESLSGIPFVVTGAAQKFFERKARSARRAYGKVAAAAAAGSERGQDASMHPQPTTASTFPPAFTHAMTFVLKWEGGFVDDPDDPGGRTNKGVTQRTYDAWRADKGLMEEDVLHITEQEMKSIYLERYWSVVVEDWWPKGLSTAVFDSAVNMGPRRAIKMLQAAINQLADGPSLACDGISGRRTVAALKDCLRRAGAHQLVECYIDIRRGVYHRIVERRPKSRKYLQGWLNRVDDLAAFVADGAYESAPIDRMAHPTKRLDDLGPDEPLEKPVRPVRPASNYSSEELYEALDPMSVDELQEAAEELLLLDEAEQRYAAALDVVYEALSAPWEERASRIKSVLKRVRQGRDFDLLHAAATEAEREGTARALARTFRAQALIELGLIDEAIATLDDALQEDRPELEIMLEIRGLRGRAFKSAYLNSVAQGAPDPNALVRSIDAYMSAYAEYGGDALWHGVNALALLKRSDAEGDSVQRSVDRDRLAREIIAFGLERIEKLPSDKSIWDRASVAEANIALGDWDEVDRHLSDYIRLSEGRFPLASTLRQFTEVWKLNRPSAHARGRRLVSELQTALARMKGETIELTADDFEALEIFADEGETGNVTEAFETIIDSEALISFEWAEKLARIGRSVARVDSNRHTTKGTAFLIDASPWLGEAANGRHFVMTNEHVVNATGSRPGIMPTSALLIFSRFPNSTPVRVKDVVWSSHREHHDTTILEIFAPPEGAVPLQIEQIPTLSGAGERARHVTVIGHPNGGQLSLAINNLELVEHNGPGSPDSEDSIYLRYKSSTEPGNSGSPIFDWDTLALMGIHHKGFRGGGHKSFQAGSASQSKTASHRRSRYGPRRRAYRTVRAPEADLIKANQGIWLESIKRAIAKGWPAPPRL
ncbi:MAG: glycosyl hydrolase 108 family protein [Pseudomonadota bacterium]